MKDDVTIAKVNVIERCIERIKEKESDPNFIHLSTHFDLQDVVILNLQRLCEATIDLAAHIVRVKGLGVPTETKEVFIFLKNAKLISDELTDKMCRMVGFRNISVHRYEDLNLDVVKSIIKNNVDDFVEFYKAILSVN